MINGSKIDFSESPLDAEQSKIGLNAKKVTATESFTEAISGKKQLKIKQTNSILRHKASKIRNVSDHM